MKSYVKVMAVAFCCLIVAGATLVPAFRGRAITYLLPSPWLLSLISLLILGAALRAARVELRPLLGGTLSAGLILGSLFILVDILMADPYARKQTALAVQFIQALAYPGSWAALALGPVIVSGLVVLGWALASAAGAAIRAVRQEAS